MKRTRRRFVFGAVAGVGTLLAGCTGGRSGTESGTETTTGAADGQTPEATTTAATHSPTPTSPGRTDSPTAQLDSPSPEGRTPTTGAPEAPTSPTAVEIISRSGALTITEIEAGPPGTDSPSLYEEHIDFENTGEEPLDVSGYTVEYGGTGRTYEFPDSYETKIDAGGTFRLTTGNGGETIMMGENGAFAGFETPVLGSSGVITVTDADGELVLKARYGG